MQHMRMCAFPFFIYSIRFIVTIFTFALKPNLMSAELGLLHLKHLSSSICPNEALRFLRTWNSIVFLYRISLPSSLKKCIGHKVGRASRIDSGISFAALRFDKLVEFCTETAIQTAPLGSECRLSVPAEFLVSSMDASACNFRSFSRRFQYFKGKSTRDNNWKSVYTWITLECELMSRILSATCQNITTQIVCERFELKPCSVNRAHSNAERERQQLRRSQAVHLLLGC